GGRSPGCSRGSGSNSNTGSAHQCGADLGADASARLYLISCDAGPRHGWATPMKLGTRGSPLALAQARAVAARLRALGADVEVVPMRTEGDRLVDAHLAAVGGKGLFVREIEEALREGHIDGAVHSLKDLPAELPAGLTLGAFTEREDPRDVLVSRSGASFEDLRAGAVVGTSSPRRRALARALRP